MVLLMLPLGLERLRLGTMAACSGAFMVRIMYCLRSRAAGSTLRHALNHPQASLQLVRLMHQTSREDRIDWTLRGFILRFFRDLVPIVSVPYSQRRSPRRFMRYGRSCLSVGIIPRPSSAVFLRAWFGQ
jgi:hypothetical protein